MRRLSIILNLAIILAAFGCVESSQATIPPAHPATCEKAQALESLGRLEAAETAYLSELDTPAAIGCAKAGLAQLAQGAESCDLAQALESAGERKAANEAYLKVLAANPASMCAKLGAEKTQASTSFWSWVGTASENAGKLLAGIVLALLVFAIAALLWLQLQTRWKIFPNLRDRWPASRIRRPTLQVATFDDGGLTEKLGVPIAGLIRGRINWRRPDRYGLDLVSGQAGISSALESLGDISSQAKGAIAVVGLLSARLARRRFVLGGEIQPSGAEGMGISLELTREGDFDSLATFWANPLGLSEAKDVEAYQHLAIVAAAWVDHRMVSTLDGESLLTNDPKSWAFFSSGVEWQRQGKDKLAGQLYQQALIMDGDNVGALANLGVIERRANHFDEAQRLLQRALKATEDLTRLPKLLSSLNHDWYRIKYQLASLYANWAAATDEPHELKSSREKDAIREALDLALSTSRAIEAQASSPKFTRFLKGTIEPGALVLAASVIPSRTGTTPPDKRPSREDVIKTLEAEQIDPWILIAFVEGSSNRSTDTSYNLGCFYAGRKDFSSATRHILRAVRETQQSERGSLVDRVGVDPTLAPLIKKLPTFLPKLKTLADSKPSKEDKLQAAQFDQEYQAIEWYESQGWQMNWAEPQAEFTLIGERNGESLLVLVKGMSISVTDVNAFDGDRTHFGRCNPSDRPIHAAIIVPGDTLSPADPGVLDAVTRAGQHEIEIYGAGEQGFALAVCETPG